LRGNVKNKLTKVQAIKVLKELAAEAEVLARHTAGSAKHIRWVAQTMEAFEDIFGTPSRYFRSFNQFTWRETSGFVIQGFDIQGAIEQRHHEAYLQQLASARGLLLAAIERVERNRLEDVYEGGTARGSKVSGGRVFIGHGRSLVWLLLRDFLEKRLDLRTDEFNREATAGVSTLQRLDQMLTDSRFAFLVLTAEDEQADGSRHARENVIHELGLFQGRLGFPKAIILLEHGCQQFSNIHGLTHIPFPAGDIGTTFEEIRRVLEREQILKAS
jgi:predicted nucleotide-binding protein